MTNFIVIDKDSLNKSTVNATQITLTEASIVHTKMSRDDVDEFIRDGNNLVLKLKNGEVVVIENFFITYDDVASDLVFEEDGCVLYWFDGVSGFKGIPGLEALLPAVEGSKLVGLLPWLVGAAVVGGAAAIIDHNDKDKTESIPNGTNTLKVNTDGTVTGKTENIPEGTDVKITISGKDKDGNNIEYQDIVKVDKDGNYVTDVPPNFADGDLVVESEVIDRNGNTIPAEDKLGTGKTDDPATPGDESAGLDRDPGSIDLTIGKDGSLTGATEDVAPGTEVVITIQGVDKDGNVVTEKVTTTVKPDGSYEAKLPAGTTIVDGSPLIGEAVSTDRNGNAVTGPDELAGAPGVTVPPELEVTLPPENGGGLDLFVRDDTHSMQEDAATINGNVLTNDTQGLTVTGIEIDGVAYGVGTNIDIPDVGTVNIGADGAYTFTPVLDYSGNVPAITYTVSNGTVEDTANLNIEVVAVADQPTTGNFEFDPPALSLNIQQWAGAKNINGNNLLENAGDGASKTTLINAIDYLRNNSGVTNSDGTSVTDTNTGSTSSLTNGDLPNLNAVYISGYVFLEAGQTYTYAGSADDSAAIVIGDGVSSLHVNWKGTSTSREGEFSVSQSGYYSFQFYAHNASGVGNYNFTVQNSDGSAMNYYPDLTSIQNSLQDTSYVLGDYDAGSDGSNDTGFYPVNMGYKGQSTDVIELTGIELKSTDTDGSEYLSFTLSGLPAGAVLTFKDALGNEHSVTVGSDGTASYIPEDKDSGTTEYTDFILTVGDKTDAVLNVTLTVMSTEKSNGDTSTSILDFEVKVTDAEASTPPTYAEDSVTGGFTNGLGEWDNADNNPWKYSENNELINYDTYLKKEAYGVRQDNAGIVEITTREPIAENALANGAKIAMQLAWNNGFSTESGQGESTVFKLIVGGVVYATVTTPSNSDSTPLDKTGQAVIVYGNGATGNVDYFDAPSYEKDGGDPSSKDFEWNNWEVYIPGVSGTPSISLQWDVQKSDVVGDPTSDDLYVKDLGVYPATTESLQLTSMLSDDNSIIFDLLNDDATGGNELQTIDGFTLGEVNDVIDISALLSADANESNWSDFITVDYNAENNQAVISIDRDGSAEQYHSENLVVLLNQPNAFDLDDLVQNNQIIIG